MIDADDIQRRIAAVLPGAVVDVRDLTGTRDHYAIDVTCAQFAGQSSLQRHRSVHAALKDVLGGALHAVQIRTATPEENLR